MGGGSSKSTTNTVATPWKEQQPYLTDVFRQAQSMYQGGQMAPAYYTGNTIAGQSPYTRNAYNAVSGQAVGGDNSYRSMANSLNTANSVMQNAISGNRGLSSLNAVGNTNSGNRALTNLLGTSGAGINAGNAGLSVLNQMAKADNPYIDQLYQRANNQAQASLDSNFNRAGRYGSGAHEAAAADAANNLANQMYSALYDKRASAAAQASSAYNQGIGQGLDAQQAAGSLYNQGIGNNIAAMNDAANAYNAALGQQLSGAGTAQNLYNQRYTDAQWLSEIGANQENYNQALIDAAIDRWNYDQQRPLTALSNYNQLIQGTYGGTTTATGKGGYSGSALGSALGGAAAGASLLSGASNLLDYFK